MIYASDPTRIRGERSEQAVAMDPRKRCQREWVGPAHTTKDHRPGLSAEWPATGKGMGMGMSLPSVRDSDEAHQEFRKGDQHTSFGSNAISNRSETEPKSVRACSANSSGVRKPFPPSSAAAFVAQSHSLGFVQDRSGT